MPGSGKFHIVSVREGIPPIGADIYDENTVKPVISAGNGDVWTLEEFESERYRITLDSAWASRQDDNNNVVVDLGSSASKQVWFIRSNGDGKYTIEKDSIVWPNLGWTLHGEAPKSPVILRLVEFPNDAQLWRFIKLPID
ncbi:hypothetical protein PAXRUDRAFT_131835 [Paxillus rubicundulus Ve08.2h10]|uniref:Ricin B lectin domain-containing protein n=1 Tax=Paxillus rubicundulus Ve08.2h10 TaxID=930991 RepID=A0A0D0DWA4_9AGAM|nr:hypothetical protein PAXRUDRAFT_131835 [Paxillus rubicundulus Ve08.2h10]